MNAGLGLAEGVYVKVVDSDDWLEKTALYNLLKTLDKWLDKAGMDTDSRPSDPWGCRQAGGRKWNGRRAETGGISGRLSGSHLFPERA